MNNKYSTQIIFILFIAAVLFTSEVSAQVTMGSNQSANPGALLDLKENIPNANNTTSTRGLGLPRVKLTNKDNLYPMFETTPGSGVANDQYTSALKPTEDKVHTGLVVYNLNKCDGFGPGTYVWVGTEWQPLAKVNVIQTPAISITTPSDAEKVDDNTYLIHLPSGRDLRTFPTDNKFSLVLNWTDPANGNLTIPIPGGISTLPAATATTPGSDEGLKFITNPPSGWTTPAITASPVTFNYEIKDMLDIITSDIAEASYPFRSRETAVTFNVPANECYPAKQITVRLNQTNYRLAILRSDWVFNNISYRIRSKTPLFSGPKIHYYRFLITDASEYDSFFFIEESNAQWKSSYTTTSSGIVSSINVPATGGVDIIDGTSPTEYYRWPGYIASATTTATRYKEAGVLTYTDAATVPRFPPAEIHIIQCRSYIYEETGIYNAGRDATGTNTTGWDNKVARHEDQNGNTFLSAVFGTAGRWMTTNLAATTYDTGSPLAGITLTAFTEKQLGEHYSGRKEYAYPQTNKQLTNIGDAIQWGDRPADWRWEEGIYYNWYAATGRDYDYLNTTNEGNTDQSQVQGICPNGWHIPSDKEWGELEKVIHANMGSYSTYDNVDLTSFGSPAWNTAWDNTSSVFRGDPIEDSNVGHGGAMKSTCPPKGGAFGYFMASRGYSSEPYLGGFNAILVGRMVGDEYGTQTSIITQDGRAWNVEYWTNSQSASLSAWFRGFEVREGGVDRSTWDKTRLMSIRCKKN